VLDAGTLAEDVAADGRRDAGVMPVRVEELGVVVGLFEREGMLIELPQSTLAEGEVDGVRAARLFVARPQLVLEGDLELRLVVLVEAGDEVVVARETEQGATADFFLARRSATVAAWGVSSAVSASADVCARISAMKRAFTSRTAF
jgi:hypothetical protein